MQSKTNNELNQRQDEKLRINHATEKGEKPKRQITRCRKGTAKMESRVTERAKASIR